jgi:predicted transcriptional regulator of viral defense system
MLFDIAMNVAQLPLPASRARLASVLRAAKEVVSIDVTSKTLGIERGEAAKLLSRWRSQGWLRRVGPGIYAPVPLDLASNEQVIADPWVLVPALFSPCYVGGWTAAHHWELTEQLFQEIFVFAARRVIQKNVTTQGARFLVQPTTSMRLFGLKTLWRGSTKVQISDPARTLIDMIAHPGSGGGIDQVSECLNAYLKGKTRDRELLIRYGEQFGNGAIFKRLGFLSEAFGDGDLAAMCRARLTQGYAKLDPSLSSDRLITAWHLWIPGNWRIRALDR